MRKVSTKKVGQYTRNGELVKVFGSYKEAALGIGSKPTSIFNCCSGKIKYHKDHKFEWFYDNIEDEVWQEHPSLKVMVSNMGRVQASKGAYLYGGHTLNGYRKVTVQKKQYLVHRLVMQTFSREEPKSTVDHIDGVKTNNRYENLRWATMKEQANNRRPMEQFKHCVSCTCDCNPKK